jgi:hypothetical protein
MKEEREKNFLSTIKSDPYGNIDDEEQSLFGCSEVINDMFFDKNMKYIDSNKKKRK